jgi:hypothetical protein
MGILTLMTRSNTHNISKNLVNKIHILEYLF